MMFKDQKLTTQEALNCVINKNIPRAIHILCQAIEGEPLSLKAYLLLGTIYMYMGHRSYGRALKVLRQGRNVCRQSMKYMLMHADLLKQDGSLQDERDLAVLLYRIADMRFYEGLFMHKLMEGFLHVGSLRQAMRLLTSRDVDDRPTPRF
jgi:lipopolysaccharide biosynthesis regulator YciM